MNQHPQTCTRCQGQGGYHKHVTTLQNGHEVRWLVCEHERDLANDRLTPEEQEILDLTSEVMLGHKLLNEACGMAFDFGRVQAEHDTCPHLFGKMERRLGQVLELEDTYLDTISDLKTELNAYKYLNGERNDVHSR